MVASRKPKPRGERRPDETLEEMYQRIIADPGDGLYNFTEEEAIYVLDRLAERPRDPNAMSGNEVVKRFYGLWPEPESADEYPD